MSFPRFVLVANTDSNRLSVFSVDNTTGRLRFRSYVATGDWPVAIAVHPSGQFAYVANSAVPRQPSSNTISVYRVGPEGSVIAVGSQVATMSTPVSLAMAPNGKNLYVACSNPAAASSGIEIFAINRITGSLARNGPAITDVTASALAADPSGTFLCVLNRNSSVISTYRINAQYGTLSATVPPLATDKYPNTFSVAPSGKFVYVGSTGAASGGTVRTYSLNPATGAFAEVASVDAGDDEIVSGLFVHPSGNFVYALLGDDRNIIVYSVNPATGVIAKTSETNLGPTPAVGIEYDSNFVIDPTGRYLYATFYASGQSNTVTAYAINPANGSLSAVQGGVVASGGVWPGALVVIAGPKPVSYTPKFAYVVTYGCNVWAYTINAATGALTPVPGSPFAMGAPHPTPTAGIAIAADPSARFVYVTNYDLDTVSAYAINPATGALTDVLGSPFATGSDPGSVVVDPSGRFAYVVNWATNTVSAYTIDPISGALTTTGPAVATGWAPLRVAVDPSGQFAYVVNMLGNSISAYTIDANTGALTPVPGSPFAVEPASAGPIGVTVDPSGRFAYVAMYDANVRTYAINTNTGALTATGPGVAAGSGPVEVAVDPSGQFAYVLTLSNVLAYTIDADTGALTLVPGSPYAPGNYPWVGLSVDPSGQFGYLVDWTANTISASAINANTGVLTSSAGSPFATGLNPYQSVIVGTSS